MLRLLASVPIKDATARADVVDTARPMWSIRVDGISANPWLRDGWLAGGLPVLCLTAQAPTETHSPCGIRMCPTAGPPIRSKAGKGSSCAKCTSAARHRWSSADGFRGGLPGWCTDRQRGLSPPPSMRSKRAAKQVRPGVTYTIDEQLQFWLTDKPDVLIDGQGATLYAQVLQLRFCGWRGLGPLLRHSRRL